VSYSQEVVALLMAIREVAGYPWSVRLKALLPLWMPWIRKRYRMQPEMERHLLQMSARQMDRRLERYKTKLRRRIYGRTKPGYLLKRHIPVKTDRWDVTTPGFTEVDPSEKRPLELIKKMNQFNLNGLRISQGEWQKYLEDRNTVLAVVSYTDKFGPLGNRSRGKANRDDSGCGSIRPHPGGIRRRDVRILFTLGSCRRFPAMNLTHTSANTDRQVSAPALIQSARFISDHWLTFLGVSSLVLAPCFWHRRIVAGDLGSHLYNAWLVQLIERGQVPGLWIAHQWNNVLFDFLLSDLGKVFDMRVAEKIAVSFSVLVFFWGMVALVCAASQRVPWFLLPCFAMFAYGFTFHMGFFNYYLAVGFSCFALAIFWRGKGWERLVAVMFAPLILLAHPLGFLWFVGAATYIGMAQIVPRRYQPLLPLLAVASLFIARYYLWHHYIAKAPKHAIYMYNGADQLVLFGAQYEIPAVMVSLFVIAALAIDVIRRRREVGLWTHYSIPLQLYVIVGLGIVMLPDEIRLPQYCHEVAVLTQRTTTLSAVLICCLLGVMRPRKWHLLGFTAIAIVFFSLLYLSSATLNNMEEQVEQLVRKLPPGQRVLMATIERPSTSRIVIEHIVDRACIGHCFSYGNYEPGSEGFRVRALPGNAYVMTTDCGNASMEHRIHEVQGKSLPAYQVYQCTLGRPNLCIRPVEVGEASDQIRVRIPQ